MPGAPPPGRAESEQLSRSAFAWPLQDPFAFRTGDILQAMCDPDFIAFAPVGSSVQFTRSAGSSPRDTTPRHPSTAVHTK